MNKQVLPILLTSCILFAGGILAYSLPEAQKIPTTDRLLMPNTAGRVVFTHAAHTKYDNMTCASCHHELSVTAPGETDEKVLASKVLSCGACHNAVDNQSFKESHQKLYDAQDGGAACITCHHTDTAVTEKDEKGQLPLGTVVGKDFASCSSCHSSFVGRMDAFHKQCMSCHEKVGKGPTSKAPCAQCHRQ